MIKEGEIWGLALFAVIMSFPYLLALGYRWLRNLRPKHKEEAVLPQTSPTPEQTPPTQVAEQQQAQAEMPKPKQKQQPKKQLEVHEGKLLAAGFAKREYGYSSYRLEIQSAALGVSHEIWGVDLKRALEASGATIGDNIKVILAGHLDVALNGDSKAQKKVFDVTKLD